MAGKDALIEFGIAADYLGRWSVEHPEREIRLKNGVIHIGDRKYGTYSLLPMAEDWQRAMVQLDNERRD